jgi:GntR family transcriptional regulator, rspAB operon transcriptional repressor
MAAAPTVLQPDAAEARSQSAQAYYAIRGLIVTLDLAPGSVVSEADLMTRLRLGRTPVREALRQLAQEHLVEVYPRRGMFVAPVDVRNLGALSEIRGVLEPFAARLAADRLTDDDRTELAALIAELDTLTGDPQERRLIEVDQRIHRFVHRASHNDYLASALDEHYMHALRIWFLALDRVTHLEDAVLEHRAILEAIGDGDAERAAAAMATHIDGFADHEHPPLPGEGRHHRRRHRRQLDGLPPGPARLD